MGIFTKVTNKEVKYEKPNFLPLEVKDLKLAAYQRGLRRSRVQRYADRYNPNIFGIILVSFRDDEYWIVDGQHRVEVAKLLGINTVWCQVLYGLTYEQEAEHFYQINDSKSRLNANHKFHSRIEAKDGQCLAILNSLQKYGFTYSKEGSEHTPNCINAVVSLQLIYRQNGVDGLNLVLEILRKAWNGDVSSLKAEIIKGLNTFITTYTFDKGFLIKVLEKNPPTKISNCASRYIGDARRPSDGVCFHIAKTIRDIYDEAALKSQKTFKVCTYRKDD